MSATLHQDLEPLHRGAAAEPRLVRHDGVPPESPAARPPASRPVAVLDLDPELGAGLTAERLALARYELRAHVITLPRGEWAVGDLASTSHSNLGLLLLDGVMAREVVLEDTVSTELLGATDLIRPWCDDDGPQPLEPVVRWQVLAEAHLAVLGRRVATALVRFPEVNAVLIDRLSARAHRLATTQAIGHLNCVDRRLLALFWHLAGRWGRMTPDGVVVPLTLSHRLLGELIGARRPTVSTALATLEREGKLVRRTDATWLLAAEPPGSGHGTLPRIISHRRRLLAREPVAGREGPELSATA